MVLLLRKFSGGSEPKQVGDLKEEEIALINKINNESLRVYFHRNKQDFPRSTTEKAVEAFNKAMDLWPNAQELKYSLNTLAFPSSDELIKNIRNHRFISVVKNKTLKQALENQSDFVCKDDVKKEEIEALNQFISENPNSEALARHLTQTGIPHTPELIKAIRTEAATDLILKIIDSQVLKERMQSLPLSLNDVTPNNLQPLHHNIKHALSNEDLKTLLSKIGITPDDAFIQKIREEHLRKQYKKIVGEQLDKNKIDKKEGWKIRTALENETTPIQKVQEMMKNAGIEVESSKLISAPPTPSEPLEIKEETSPKNEEPLAESSEVQKEDQSEDQENILKNLFRTIVLNELQKKVKETKKTSVKKTIERIMFSYQWEDLSIHTMRALLKESGLQIEGLQFFDAFENETRETRIREINSLLAQLEVLEQIEEKVGLAKSWLESSEQYAETLKAENPSFVKTNGWDQLQQELDLLRKNLRALNDTLSDLDTSHLLVARAHTSSAAIQNLFIEAGKPAFTISNQRKSKRSLSLEKVVPVEPPTLEIKTDAFKKSQKEVSQQTNNQQAAFSEAVIQTNFLELTEGVGALKARMADIPRLSEEEKNTLGKVAADPLAHLQAIQATAERFQSVKDEKEELESLGQKLKKTIETVNVNSKLNFKANDALTGVSSLEKETEKYLEDLTWLEKQSQQAKADYFTSLELPPLEPIGSDLKELQAAQTQFVNTQAMLEEKGVSLPQTETYEKALDAAIERVALDQKEKSENAQRTVHLEKLKAFQNLAKKYIEEAQKLMQAANKYNRSGEIPPLEFMQKITEIQMTLKGNKHQLALKEGELLHSQTITTPDRAKIEEAVKDIQAFRDRFEEKAKKKAEKEAKKAEKEAQKALTRESNLQLKLEEALESGIPKILDRQLTIIERTREFDDVLKEFDTLALLVEEAQNRQHDRYKWCQLEYKNLEKEDFPLSTETKDLMSVLTAQIENPSTEIAKTFKKAKQKVEKSALKEKDLSRVQGLIKNLEKASQQGKDTNAIEKARNTILESIDKREKRYFDIRRSLKDKGFVFTDPKDSQAFNEIGIKLASFKADVESLSPEKPKPKSLRLAREEHKTVSEDLHGTATKLYEDFNKARKELLKRFSDEASSSTLQLKDRIYLIEKLNWLNEKISSRIDGALAGYNALVKDYNESEDPAEQEALYYNVAPLAQPFDNAIDEEQKLFSKIIAIAHNDVATFKQKYKDFYRGEIQAFVKEESNRDMSQPLSNEVLTERVTTFLALKERFQDFEEKIKEIAKIYSPISKEDPTLNTDRVREDIFSGREAFDVSENISSAIELNIQNTIDIAQEKRKKLEKVIAETPTILAKLFELLKLEASPEEKEERAKEILPSLQIEQIQKLQTELNEDLKEVKKSVLKDIEILKTINPKLNARDTQYFTNSLSQLSEAAKKDLEPIIKSFESKKISFNEQLKMAQEIVEEEKREKERRATQPERPLQEPEVEAKIKAKASEEEIEPVSVETEIEQPPVIPEEEKTTVAKKPSEPMVEKPELEIVVEQVEMPANMATESEIEIQQPAAAQQSAQSVQPPIQSKRQQPAEFDLHHFVVTASEKISGATTGYTERVTKGLVGFGEKIKKMFSFKRPLSTSSLVKGFPPAQDKRPVSAIEAERDTKKSSKKSKQQRKIAPETAVSMKRQPSSLSLEERRERVEAFDHEAYAKGIVSLGADLQRLRVEVLEAEKQAIDAENVLKGNTLIEHYSMEFRNKNQINFNVPDNQYVIDSPKAMKDLAKVLVACHQPKIDVSELPKEHQKTARKIFMSHGIETIGIDPEIADKPESLVQKVKSLRDTLRVR